MADGMMAMDPDRDWKAMKKAGKRLFQRLGALRDVQIMMEWIEKLHPTPINVGRAPSPAPAESPREYLRMRQTSDPSTGSRTKTPSTIPQPTLYSKF